MANTYFIQMSPSDGSWPKLVEVRADELEEPPSGFKVPHLLKRDGEVICKIDRSVAAWWVVKGRT